MTDDYSTDPRYGGRVGITKEKAFKVEGVDYTPEGIEDLRRELIEFRTEAMNQNAWGPVVTLAHTIALLAYLKEILDGKAP